MYVFVINLRKEQKEIAMLRDRTLCDLLKNTKFTK